MSRSYRKPYAIDECNKKRSKRLANKRVRKSKVMANEKHYKKASCSWDICDYKLYCHSKENKEIYSRK